jgi:hypothetical protein
MTPASDRDSAADLAARIKTVAVDPSIDDEANLPPGDRPPAYAEVLMSEAPTSVERSAKVSLADWQLIGKALEHFAACDRQVP